MQTGDKAQKDMFASHRETCIRICVENGGKFNKDDFLREIVTTTKKSSMHHKNKGKAITLAKYKKKFKEAHGVRRGTCGG